jgi:hypothetical protein
LKGSPEGDQPLDYKQKLRKSRKMFLTLPKELFKIWEPYKGGRFFFSQIRIFHEWKVLVYLKRREVNGNLRGENLISSKLRRSGQTEFKGLKELGVGINRDLGRLRMVEPVE